MPILLQLFKELLMDIQPYADINVVIFMVTMYASLASSLYSTYLLLKREDKKEGMMLLGIPFVLFGTVAIMEPFVTGTIFALSDPFELSGYQSLFGREIYWETLTLISVFALISIQFVMLSAARIEKYREKSKLWITVMSCGFELLLSIALGAVSILSLTSGPPVLTTLPPLCLSIFFYSILTVSIKTAIQFFILIYALLFGERKHMIDEFASEHELLEKGIRKKCRFRAMIVFVFMIFAAACIVPQLLPELGTSDESVMAAAIIIILGLILTGNALVNIIWALFPNLHPQIRRAAKQNNMDMD